MKDKKNIFYILFIKVKNRLFAIPKMMLTGIYSLFSILIILGIGANIMNADTGGKFEITDKFLDKVVVENKDFIPHIDKKILLISNEAIIKQKGLLEDGVELAIAEDKIKFEKENNLSNSFKIKFIYMGKGTLVTGKDLVNRSILIESRDGKKCNAKTNNTGKFGCMFSKSMLTIEDIKINYIK